MSSSVVLHWYSGELIIENSHPGIEEELKYWHKQFADEADHGGNRRCIKERVNLYTVLQEANPRRILTFQGLIDSVIAICKKCDLSYTTLDKRIKFPGPQAGLTKGWRYGQFGVWAYFMRASRSGILKAPTRWGKTTAMVNTLRAYPGIKSAIVAPEADLLRQLQSEVTIALPDREVRGIFTGSKGKIQSDDITIVSMDSLHKLDHASVKLVLVDEPHALATAGRIVEFQKFKNARIYAFGATTSGRFDNADKVITGLCGPVLVQKTFKEAVKEGAICPIVVYALKVKFDTFRITQRLYAYRKLIYASPVFAHLVGRIAQEIIPADWQTLVFIQEANQRHMARSISDTCEVAVASRMDTGERKDRFDAMASGEIKRCLATGIYATGVTFPHLRCIINAAGGGGSITATQKPGRLAQRQPGKKAGYLIDFTFECNQQPEVGIEDTVPNEEMSLTEIQGLDKPSKEKLGWTYVVKDCHSRLGVYKSLGYEIRKVNSIEEIKLE